MTIYIDTMPAYDSAAAEEAWDWLNDNQPRYAKATRIQVDKNHTPDQIYHYLLGLVGQHREPLAMRCKLAATHLWESKDK